MIRHGQNGQLRLRQEPKHLRRMLGSHNIPVAGQNESWRGNRSDLLRRPSLELPHPAHAFIEVRLELVRMDRCLQVRLTQFLWHRVQRWVCEGFPESGVTSTAGNHRGFDDEPAHNPRMPERDLYGNVAAVAVAHN